MLELFYEKKDLVITPTHFPKPIYQVAENITVIYSEQIAAMNAHTVAEVLRWIPGMYVSSSRDFGATSLLTAQGSSPRHVTVLLDGIPWNTLSGGNAETITIPVGIIDHIEIIKGPASSAWGSSLGGIVNIITKAAAGESIQGNAYISYGEASSLDVRVETSGGSENLAYYLFAGQQKSDGLLDGRKMENLSVFTKFNMVFSQKTGVDVIFGFSAPENNLGTFPSNDIQSDSEISNLYGSTSLNVDLTPRSTFNLSGYYIGQDYGLNNEFMGLWGFPAAGDLYIRSDYEEKIYGAAAKIIWEPDEHAVVMGTEISRGDLYQLLQTGTILQLFYGVEKEIPATSNVFSWAVYINDTFSLDRWTVTPGARFDHNTVSGDFFSPSLGVTYQYGSNLLYRGTVSRGFHYPPLSYSEGGGLFLDPNPDLEAEEVWSYQLGMETTILPRMRIKATLFQNDMDQTLISVAGGGDANNALFINYGEQRRRGFELEVETDPIRNVSIEISGDFIDIDADNIEDSFEYYTCNLIISYDNPGILTVRLAGHYADVYMESSYQSNLDDIIWDLNLIKPFTFGETLSASFFITARNLFSGNQHHLLETKNPGQWFESGIRFAF